MPRVLNIPKFRIWEGPQYASVTQRSKYARICLDRLNIFWVLNIPELQRWQVSEYTSLTEVFKYATMSEQDVNMPQYVWIYDNKQGSKHLLYNTYIARGDSTRYWVIIEK